MKIDGMEHATDGWGGVRDAMKMMVAGLATPMERCRVRDVGCGMRHTWCGDGAVFGDSRPQAEACGYVRTPFHGGRVAGWNVATR